MKYRIKAFTYYWTGSGWDLDPANAQLFSRWRGAEFVIQGGFHPPPPGTPLVEEVVL
jgi:hypothetical protein